jgi:hypothetical protein
MNIKFHIPMDFDLAPDARGGVHIASGDTGEFWSGLLLAALFVWQFTSALRPGGEIFLMRGGPFDRDDFYFWPMVAMSGVIALAGLYMVLAAAFDGTTF